MARVKIVKPDAVDDPKSISDADTDGRRTIGRSDKGIVRRIHIVSDFTSYNRLNLACGCL